MNQRPDKRAGALRIARAFGSTWRGFRAAWRDEAAFRQECALAAVVIPLGLWLGATGVERALLVGPAFLLLVIELVNSALEATVDRIGVERHPLSGIAKELGSAAVFVAFVLLAVNWLLVLGMAALICGSLAYDTVMVYPGRFRDQILPDKIHMLNVSFLVPTLRRYFGGCAGNIAFNLKLLDCDGHAMGAVGHDFGPYRDWMVANGMSLRHVRVIEDEYTAQAYITTDLDANQLTAFHPGAMNQSWRLDVPRDGSITIGVLAPDGREGMIAHARQFAAARIPFVFDPGQAMTLFDGPELAAFVEQADWVTVNDYEAQLLQERTGLSADALAARVKGYVVTRGAQGSIVLAGGRRFEIPAVGAAQVVDPTGCGDAYRAGLLYGLMRGIDWQTTGRIASLMGAIKIATVGTQHHRFTLDEFRDRFHDAFQYRLD